MRFEATTCEVAGKVDAEDPQDAAETYAAQLGLREPMRVWVREPGAPEWTMWEVEAVTTYRARPA